MPRVRAYAAQSARLYPLGGGKVVIPPAAPAGGGTGPPTGGSTGMLFGASTPQSSSGMTWDSAQATSGPWQITRAYNGGDMRADWSLDVSGPDIGKRASVWSAKPNMADLLAGKLDATITALVSSIPDSQVAFLEIWHEADVKLRSSTLLSGAGVSTLADFNEAKFRFYSLVKSVGKPHVCTCLVLANYSINGYSGPTGTPDQFWVGPTADDRVIDVVAWDGYAHGAATTSAADTWDAARNWTDGKGAAWAIAELGLDEDVTDMSAGATWLGNQVAYASTNGAGPHKSAAFVCLFNSTVGEVIAVPGADPTLQAASRSIGVQYGTDWKSFVL